MPATEDKYISIDDGPVTFVSKITGTIQNEDTKTLTVKSLLIEDSIRPVELKFRPPLQQDGTDTTCFDYQWQQLTYLFELDDPSAFVNIVDSLSDEDKRLLIRYVKTCRNLAGYSVINTKNGLEMSWGRGGSGSTVRVDLPSHEEFSGFSATFRQLHNDGEAASFNKAWRIVNTAVNAAGLEESTLAAARATLKAWKQARARLMEKAAATLIAEKLNPNLKPEHPRPLKGIVPEDLIRQFNYGDTLHWGINEKSSPH